MPTPQPTSSNRSCLTHIAVGKKTVLAWTYTNANDIKALARWDFVNQARVNGQLSLGNNDIEFAADAVYRTACSYESTGNTKIQKVAFLYDNKEREFGHIFELVYTDAEGKVISCRPDLSAAPHRILSDLKTE